MNEVLDRIENRGIEIGIERGIKRGIERGIEQGDRNRAKKVAFRLKRKGLPIEDIADVVEMDISTVASWIQNMPEGDGI